MKTLDNAKYIKAPQLGTELSDEQILGKVKDINLFGQARINRGNPLNVESREIFTYRNKAGNYVANSIGELNQSYLDELYQEQGMLSKEKTGKAYFLSTSNPNSSMSDPTTGTPTSFQYRVFADGNEDLYFDAIPFASTNYNEKIQDSSLKKIVKVMNPSSKIL